MTLPELLVHAAKAGVKLRSSGGRLLARPRELVTPEFRKHLDAHRAELIKLLDPARDQDQTTDCPASWLALPILPDRSTPAITKGPDGSGLTYRIRLYGQHYRLTFHPRIGSGQVRAVRADGLTWEAPSLTHLQRLAWTEHIILATTRQE